MLSGTTSTHPKARFLGFGVGNWKEGLQSPGEGGGAAACF